MLMIAAPVASAKDIRLPKTEDEKLCLAFQEQYYPNLALSNISIAVDYGTYNGCRVVLMDVQGIKMTDDMLHMDIAGYTFEFGSGSCRNLFLAYDNGAFTTVQEAYLQGMLTQDNIASIYYARTGTPFMDVKQSDWYHSAVKYTFEKNLMNGISDKEFLPDGTMTRAMLVTVLWRASGSPKGLPNTFIDVANNVWYSEAVAWASSNGLVNGVGNGRFAPNNAVTREQFVTILFRLSGDMDYAPALGDSYWDANQISPWAEKAMRWAIAKGIIEGSQDKGIILFPSDQRYLAPGKSATRAQAAAILMRYQAQELKISAKDLMKGITTDYQPTNEFWKGAELTEESANAIADFSIELFKKAMATDENTVLSPMSALYALAMLTNGADGMTKNQLEKTIGLTTEEMNLALRELRTTLKGYSSTVNLANSIWVRDGFEVKPNYLQINADYYQAAAYQAPFDKTTVKEINDWISRNTDGLIPKMIDEISDETMLMLINAILFEAQWVDPYATAVEEPFYPATGERETADMLKSCEKHYLEDNYAIGFRKSFQDGFYDFAVIVPKEGISLEDYMKSLDGTSLRKLLVGTYVDEVHATMPEFKTETSKELNDALKEMGIVDVFLPGEANLTGIADNLYASKVFQRATIDVNKKGVSAAAATIIQAEITAPAPPEDPVIKIVKADRPYLYMIIDARTNLPLFIGTTVTVQ